MKILLVHKFFHVTGGAEVFFFETARVLEGKGHTIGFFSTHNDNNRPSSYETYFANAPDYRQGSIFQRMGAIGDIVYSRKTKQKFRQLLNDFKPDIVHVFAIFTHLSPSILDACREAGVPVVMSCNDYKHLCPNYKFFHHGRLCGECKGGRFYRAIVNRCCHNSLAFSVASCVESTAHHAMDILRRNVDTFLFAGDFMAQKTEEFWGKDTFRWRKLANPYASSRYPLSPEFDDYILFFGRFVDEKGADILLQAMAEVRQAKLLMVGDGPEKERLLSMKRELNLENVEFVGPKWGEELDACLRRARFTIVPSIWHENFPYVILQAFAFGKPVIGSDRGGIPELIADGERGFIYPGDNPGALAAAIGRLWNNPTETIQMGRNAKKYVDAEFTDDKFYAQLMSIYAGAAESRGDRLAKGSK